VSDRNLNALADEELMHRLAQGEMDALGVIYRRHGALVKAALGRTAREAPLAEIEEMSQEVFLSVADSASRYEERQRFKAWLYGVAVQKARVWRRNTWLRRNLLGRHPGEGAGTARKSDTSPVRQAELRESISGVLAKLPEIQQEVLVLYAAQGFTCDEIAEILKIRPKTVRTRLHRARQKLLGSVTEP